jgi:hypothetical protein
MYFESLEIINRRLDEQYGRTHDTPNFRIVWSDSQYEKRECTHTREGFLLLYPEVREERKYWHYIRERHILERLTAVPDFQQKEVAGHKLSYEPVWVFEDPRNANPLQPSWVAAKFIIDTINKNIEAAGSYTKYKHPESGLTKSQLFEKRRAEIIELESVLFENETEVGDALAYKEGVGFTTTKIMEEKDGNT